MQHMQEFIMSTDPHLLEAALTLFAQLTEWLDAEKYLQPQAQQMHGVLLNCLGNAEPAVAIAAVKASCNFILVRRRLARRVTMSPRRQRSCQWLLCCCMLVGEAGGQLEGRGQAAGWPFFGGRRLSCAHRALHSEKTVTERSGVVPAVAALPRDAAAPCDGLERQRTNAARQPARRFLKRTRCGRISAVSCGR
jgi:hypothetical protein